MHIFDSLKNKMNIGTINKKLKRLESLDQGHLIFGSESHKYKMNPPLSAEQLKEFEDKYRITMPMAYKLFLLSIGDGGAGPFYGLFKLVENDGMMPDITRPFAYTSKRPFNMMAAYEEIPEDISDEEQEKILDEIYANVDRGFIVLATEGCGMYSVLIVNGEAFGTVWFYDLANDAGVFPLISPTSGNPMDFLEWYEIWLDQSIEHLKTEKETFSTYMDFIEER